MKWNRKSSRSLEVVPRKRDVGLNAKLEECKLKLQRRSSQEGCGFECKYLLYQWRHMVVVPHKRDVGLNAE